MTPDAWRSRIERRAGEAAIPIRVQFKGGYRLFWVPARYRSVAAAALDGRRFTVRGLADRTCYSVKGAWAALQSLSEMGIGRLVTALGCRGGTRFLVNPNAKVERDRRPADLSEQPSPALLGLFEAYKAEETFMQAQARVP